MDILTMIFVFIVFIIMFITPIIIPIVIFILISNKKKKNQSKEDNLYKQVILNDENFNPTFFEEKAKECITLVHENINKFDYNKLMPLESIELFNNHKEKIKSAINYGKMDAIDIKDIYYMNLINSYISGDKEVLGYKLKCKLYEFTIDYATKGISNYKQNGVITWMYAEFIRKKGVKTKESLEIATERCPNCGAFIEINNQSKCIYCDSTIINGNYSWVLNKIEPFYLLENINN